MTRLPTVTALIQQQRADNSLRPQTTSQSNRGQTEKPKSHDEPTGSN